ncbi:MAG TPA: hypothetical protein VK102_08105 [Sphingobacterium sp.]|nr:hypothetical protein [Sphingobacterium sp.]
MGIHIKLIKFTKDDFGDYFELVISNEKVLEMIMEKAIEKDEAKSDFQKLIQSNNLHPNFGSFKIIGNQLSA